MGFFLFFHKTRCPIFSQMHLIDLSVLKNNNCCFPPLLVSKIFYSITFLCTSLDPMLWSSSKMLSN